MAIWSGGTPIIMLMALDPVHVNVEKVILVITKEITKYYEAIFITIQIIVISPVQSSILSLLYLLI